MQRSLDTFLLQFLGNTLFRSHMLEDGALNIFNIFLFFCILTFIVPKNVLLFLHYTSITGKLYATDLFLVLSKIFQAHECLKARVSNCYRRFHYLCCSGGISEAVLLKNKEILLSIFFFPYYNAFIT